MKEFIWSVRVYYEDTDAAGVVYHANYLKFMERARTEWLREMGIEQTQLKQQYNCIFVMRQISIDFLKPALFNDLLDVSVSITQLGKASLTIAQQVLRDTDIICTAVAKVAAVNAVSLRPQKLSPNLLKALKINN